MHANFHRKLPCLQHTPGAGRWKMISRRYQVLACTAQLPPAQTGHSDWPKGRFRNKMLLQMEDLRLGLNFEQSEQHLRG